MFCSRTRSSISGLRRFPTFPFNVIQSFGCFLSPSFYLFCPFSAGFLDRNSPSWPSAFGSQMEVSSVITFFESETRTSFAFLRSLKRKTTSFMALWHFMPLRIYGLVSVAGDSRVVVFESGSRLAAEQEEEPAEWVIGATVPSAKNLKRKNWNLLQHKGSTKWEEMKTTDRAAKKSDWKLDFFR